MTKKQKLLELVESDAALLESIAGYLEVPETQVLRWALRYYALSGPWPADGPRVRLTVIGRQSGLVVGPKRQEVS